MLAGAAVADAVRACRVHRFHHDLGDDPRFDPEAVALLTRRVPQRAVVQHLGDLPLLLPRGDAPALPLGPDQVAREIRDNGSWVRVGGIEQVEGWDELVGACMAGIAEPQQLLAQVFLASPGAVTPAHFDSYHNLLFQVHGSKELTVGEFSDKGTERREIARRFGPEHENLRTLPDEITVHHLAPGDGLYLPPDTFHWARCGPDVSLALSCTFSNAASRRRMSIHVFNAHLRRFGVDPALPGTSAVRDATKYWLERLWRSTGRVRRSVRLRRVAGRSPRDRPRSGGSPR